MLRYAITDRHLYPGTEEEKRKALLAQASRLAGQGIDFLQLREKDLGPDDLLNLARSVSVAIAQSNTRLLLNASPQVALAAGAHGVHLTSTALQALLGQVSSRPIPSSLLVSVSCHTVEELDRAKAIATLILFAPVFEKPLPGQPSLPGTGIHALAEACKRAAPIPVLALGGVTDANTPLCLAAGAAGIASIRLFSESPETQ